MIEIKDIETQADEEALLNLANALKACEGLWAVCTILRSYHHFPEELSAGVMKQYKRSEGQAFHKMVSAQKQLSEGDTRALDMFVEFCKDD